MSDDMDENNSDNELMVCMEDNNVNDAQKSDVNKRTQIINLVSKPPLDYSSQILGNIKIHTFPSIKMYNQFESEVSDDESIGIYVRKYLYILIEEPQISEQEFLLIDDVEVSSIIRLILDNEPKLNEIINESDGDLISSFKDGICLYHKMELEKARDTLNAFSSSIKNNIYPINDVLSPIFESINANINYEVAALYKSCDSLSYLPLTENQLDTITGSFGALSCLPQIQKQLDIITGSFGALPCLRLIENQLDSLGSLVESIASITDGWQTQLSSIVENFARISGINFASFNDRLNTILSRHMLYLTPRLLDDTEFIDSFLEILDKDKYKENEIYRLFWGYFSKNNYANLSIMIRSWSDNVYFTKRMKIFNTSLRFLRLSSELRGVNSSLLIIPTLLPQIENVKEEFCREYIYEIKSGGKTKWKNSCGGEFDKKESAEYDHLSQLLEDDCGVKLFESLFESSIYEKEPLSSVTFNRNKILHGQQLNYGRKENLIRCFLLLDILDCITRVKITITENTVS